MFCFTAKSTNFLLQKLQFSACKEQLICQYHKIKKAVPNRFRFLKIQLSLSADETKLIQTTTEKVHFLSRFPVCSNAVSTTLYRRLLFLRILLNLWNFSLFGLSSYFLSVSALNRQKKQQKVYGYKSGQTETAVETSTMNGRKQLLKAPGCKSEQTEITAESPQMKDSNGQKELQ